MLTFLGLFVAVAAIGSDARRRGQLLEGLTLGMTLVVVVALLSRLEPWLYPAQDLQRFAPEFRPRLAYPFGYWNAVGSFAAVAIVLLVHAAARADRSPRYRAIATALLPVAGLTLYLTFSRGGMIAVALGCALILWLSPRRLAAGGVMAIGGFGTAVVALLVRSYAELNDGLIEDSTARSQGHRVLVALIVVSALAFAVRLWAERSPLPRRVVDALTPHRRKLGIAALVLALAALAAASPRIADRIAEFEPVVAQSSTDQNVQTRLSSASGNGRYQFWSASWDAWQSQPVGGRGAGTWEFWWTRNSTINAPTRDSHSVFFDVLAELGTLGVAALLAVFATALWFALAAARAASGAARASLAAVAGATLTWSVGAAVDWFWEFAALGVVFFALAALAAAARRDQLSPRAADAARPARTPLTAGLALAAWLVIVVQAIALTASWNIKRSEDAVARNDLTAAADAANLARAIEPWAAEPRMQLALVRVRQLPEGSSRPRFEEAIAAAQEAVDRESTNWRTWSVLTRVKARAGRLGEAARDSTNVRRLAPASPFAPTYQELQDLAESRDVSLSPESQIHPSP